MANKIGSSPSYGFVKLSPTTGSHSIGVGKLITIDAHPLWDRRKAIVAGPSHPRGAWLEGPDIRAGMAMLIATLCADGTSTINNARQIDRGYERIDERLNALGAKITRLPAREEGFVLKSVCLTAEGPRRGGLAGQRPVGLANPEVSEVIGSRGMISSIRTQLATQTVLFWQMSPEKITEINWHTAIPAGFGFWLRHKMSAKLASKRLLCSSRININLWERFTRIILSVKL